MPRYLPKTRTLAVITTNRCNAKCKHCISASAPDRAEMLSFEQIRQVLDQILVDSPLEQVTFTGGEPTLLGEDLLDSIAYASDKGLSTRVVTNAKWAKNAAYAKPVIDDLRAAGLDEINISTDDYHLPDIPIERVKFAWHASKNQGFATVSLANASGVGSKINPTFLQEFLGESIPLAWDEDGDRLPFPPPAADGTVYLISNSTTNILGRGNEFVPITEVVKREEDRFIGHCPLAFRNAALTPKGHLAACCGCEVEDNPVLDVGSIAQGGGFTRVRDDADDRVLMVAIATLGPHFLKETVQEYRPEIRFRERYSNVCEICEEVTRRPDVVAALHERIGEVANAILEVAPNGQDDLVKLASLAAAPRVEP